MDYIVVFTTGNKAWPCKVILNTGRSEEVELCPITSTFSFTLNKFQSSCSIMSDTNLAITPIIIAGPSSLHGFDSNSWLWAPLCTIVVVVASTSVRHSNGPIKSKHPYSSHGTIFPAEKTIADKFV